MTTRYERIRHNVAVARRLWREFAARNIPWHQVGLRDERRFFGASKHGFELLPPLRPEAVAAWEGEYQVELPDEYKSFLTRVGAGGAGPYYGLAPLRDWARLVGGDREQQLRWLRSECVLREGLPTEDEEWLNLVVGEDWERRFNDYEWDPGFGTLPVVDEGCAMQIVLVLNGPYRGRLCHLDWLSAPAFYKQKDFLDWYEGWLEMAITGDGSAF